MPEARNFSQICIMVRPHLGGQGVIPTFEFKDKKNEKHYTNPDIPDTMAYVVSYLLRRS